MGDRTKPWYRARNVVLAGFLLVILLIGVTSFRAVTATPGTSINYMARYGERIARDQPKGPNGWPDLRAAVEGFVEITVGDRWDSRLPDGWPEDLVCDEAIDQVRQGTAPEVVLRRIQELSAQIESSEIPGRLDRLSASTRIVRELPAEGRLIDLLLPELGTMRGMARYESWRLAESMRAGDWDGAVRHFERGMGMARICTMQGTLIEHLVGYAIAALMTQELRYGLAEHAPDGETIASFEAVMDRQTPLGEIALAMDCERLSVLDIIQRTHSDNGKGDGRLLLSEVYVYTSYMGPGVQRTGIMTHPIANVAGLFMPGKRATTAKANQFYDGVIEWAAMDRTERQAAAFQPDTWAATLGWSDMLLKMMVPAISRVAHSADRSERHLRGTRLMLGIEAHRARTGSYPSSLEVLADQEYEIDDPLADGPFGYRVTEAGGYVLVAHPENSYVPILPGEAPPEVTMGEDAEALGERLNVPRPKE